MTYLLERQLRSEQLRLRCLRRMFAHGKHGVSSREVMAAYVQVERLQARLMRETAR